MPGQRINEQQIRLYMRYRKEGKSQHLAAVKSGFSDRSSRNVEGRNYQEAKRKRLWRTRQDPLEDVWQSELMPMLERNPALQAKTLLEYLQNKYSDDYPDKLLRTIQRRVREWKAIHGPEKAVIFRQEHPPGWQGLSDFTPTSKLEVTIRNERLDHNLYHYRLAFSGWEYAKVVLGGESFTALAEGLQNALWQSGGSPETHRSDSLSAAFKNLSKPTQDDLTERYENLCAYYGMEPTRNNKGESHENGTIESSHRHLKSRLAQALMIRGSRNFETIEEYRQFVREVVARHNRRIHKLYLEELAVLKELPARKTTDFTEERVRVTSSGTIYVKEVVYSVPSRLIGMTLKVHLYDDRLECFVGGDFVVTLTRKRRSKGRVRQIDYRHLIGSLSRKPGAFKNYIYQDEFFPTLAFRQTWERLNTELDGRTASREYIAILKEAAGENCEQIVGFHLEKRLLNGHLPRAIEVQRLFKSESKDLPEMDETCGDLVSYNQFIGGV